jgi:predicted O-methyltransferase YrrM
MPLEARAKQLVRDAAQLPWRATRALPWVTQRRIQLLLGHPPLGPDGVWSAVDPHATYAQRPSDELLQILLAAAASARTTHPNLLIERAAGTPYSDWADAFPGEHYRLLAALVATRAPKLVVEIGTYTGAGALALLGEADPDCQIVTYDIIPWDEIPGSLLRAEDFSDGRLRQRIVDMSSDDTWRAEQGLFERADIVFLDGPKDDRFEPLMLGRLAALRRKVPYLLVVDDIRFLEMVEPWARFPSPKIDATTFGHWSGTGLALVGGASSDL